MQTTKQTVVLLAAYLGVSLAACTPVIYRSVKPDEAVVNPCAGEPASPGLSLTIVDETDARIPGVIVTMLREGTPLREAEVVTSVVTDSVGSATVLLAEAGRYEVQAALPGFYETGIRGLRVDSGCHVELRHIPLEIDRRGPDCDYGGNCSDN